MLSKEVMVRNLRGGQTFSLVSVTHPALWTTAVLWSSLGRKCYYKDHPKSLKESYFWHCEAEQLAESDIKLCVYTVPSLLMGKTCSEVYLLYPASMESPGPTSSAASQGIARLLSVNNLFTTWKWTNGKLVLSPVLISTCNGSISKSWKFHLPKIWMKIMLSAQSWKEKWELTSSYVEERLLFILPSNSTNVHGDDQGAGNEKHPLHSAGQCGLGQNWTLKLSKAPSLSAATLTNLKEIFPLQ